MDTLVADPPEAMARLAKQLTGAGWETALTVGQGLYLGSSLMWFAELKATRADVSLRSDWEAPDLGSGQAGRWRQRLHSARIRESGQPPRRIWLRSFAELAELAEQDFTEARAWVDQHARSVGRRGWR